MFIERTIRMLKSLVKDLVYEEPFGFRVVHHYIKFKFFSKIEITRAKLNFMKMLRFQTGNNLNKKIIFNILNSFLYISFFIQSMKILSNKSKKFRTRLLSYNKLTK